MNNDVDLKRTNWRGYQEVECSYITGGILHQEDTIFIVLFLFVHFLEFNAYLVVFVEFDLNLLHWLHPVAAMRNEL